MRRAAAFAALAACLTTAAEPAPVPGPIRCYNLTGPRAGKFHDPVCEFGLNPFVLVIARDLSQAKADSPVARLLQQVEDLAKKSPKANLGSAAVFAVLKMDLPFDEERAAPLAAIEALAKDAMLSRTILGLTQSEHPALKDYGVGPDDAVTILVCDRLRVIGRYAFTKDKPPGEDAITAVVGQVGKLLGEKSGGRPGPATRPVDR